MPPNRTVCSLPSSDVAQAASPLKMQPLSRLWFEVAGCLWTLPGVHKDGIKRRFLRNPDGSLVFDQPQPEYDLSAFVPVEVKAGSLVLLDGANVHYSNENTSPYSRHAYSVHFVEGVYKWSTDNWWALDSGFAQQSCMDSPSLIIDANTIARRERLPDVLVCAHHAGCNGGQIFPLSLSTTSLDEVAILFVKVNVSVLTLQFPVQLVQ
jgi:Phytanoyl-CoA dioxygenase (PhyH)